jgi:hypothetical protein
MTAATVRSQQLSCVTAGIDTPVSQRGVLNVHWHTNGWMLGAHSTGTSTRIKPLPGYAIVLLMMSCHAVSGSRCAWLTKCLGFKPWGCGKTWRPKFVPLPHPPNDHLWPAACAYRYECIWIIPRMGVCGKGSKSRTDLVILYETFSQSQGLHFKPHPSNGTSRRPEPRRYAPGLHPGAGYSLKLVRQLHTVAQAP